MPKITMRDRLLNLGLIMKKKREALGKSIRDIEQESGISKTLISQLENGLRDNTPKSSTLKKIEKALLYENSELHKIVGLIEGKDESPIHNPGWQDDLRIFLATNLSMSAINIQRSMHYIQGLRLIQEIEEGEIGKQLPELREKMIKFEI